jgi:hypothetical protein
MNASIGLTLMVSLLSKSDCCRRLDMGSDRPRLMLTGGGRDEEDPTVDGR